MASSRNSGSPEDFVACIRACLRRRLPAVTGVQRLVVGFSGGRDSVALLHVLKLLQAEFGYELGACHVHHGLSVHASEWQDFCQQFCDRIGVPLKTQAVKVPCGAPDGVEAAARNCRYEVFAGIEADWLVLAQHRGDQTETLLFNLLRGGGVHGARAMPEVRSVRDGLYLLRPMLQLSRLDIESYLQSRSLQWVEDESNADIQLSRNFLRHRVIPLLQSRFPAAEERLAAAALRFAETAALLDDLACQDLYGVSVRFPIPVSCLAGLSQQRARNALRFMLCREGAMIPSDARLREALRQLLEARQDRHPSIAFGNWRLFRKGGDVCLEKTLGDAPGNKLK